MSRHPYPDFKPTFENRVVALSMLFCGALMSAFGGLLAMRLVNRTYVLFQDPGMMVQPSEPVFLFAVAVINLTLLLAGGVVIRASFQLSAADRAERQLLQAQSQAERLLDRLPLPESLRTQPETAANPQKTADQDARAA